MALIGVLALQGAFREHAAAVSRLGADVRELRQRSHLDGIDALILPGGESTVMGKLLTELGMLEPVRERIAAGMPIYGSCAGLILLCETIEASDQPRIGLLHASVRRNAFGRQADSFETDLAVAGLDAPLRAVFIRAPLITAVGPDVEVLARVDMAAHGGAGERIVAVRQGNILATSFHPELTPDTRLHAAFLAMLPA
ncbi:pyridoxal 5'-phosphate synthase glutaminase subunit PdxT [uncultured Desulfovibrio sp.]|uniref:pyridoxal 5'-phosphate synthase glutaminase subunit PdxT n=1 Tax=uncultured Desulfovibrio sp. TaxID=167968 RepID=UPI00320B0BC2